MRISEPGRRETGCRQPVHPGTGMAAADPSHLCEGASHRSAGGPADAPAARPDRASARPDILIFALQSLPAVRHKRPFEQSPRNGRLASESCHWHGVASPGGHNIITMRPRPLVVLGNGVERCLGLPERELVILATVPSPRRMGHVRVPQSSWRVQTWRPRQWWLRGGGDPVLDGAVRASVACRYPHRCRGASSVHYGQA